MNPIEKNTRKDRVWVVIFCCFLMVFCGIGFCSNPKSLFLDPITEAYGFEKSVFTVNDTCRYGATAIVSLFFVKLLNKLGTKKMILAGFGLLIASQALYALSSSILLFYLAGMLLGSGLALMGSSTVSYVIHRRCPKNAGTIQGFVLSANGLAGALATQILSPLIEQGVYGYKNAYWTVVGVLAVSALLVAILFREDTTSPHTAGEKKKKARGQGWVGITYEEGKKKPYFYAASVLVFLTGIVISGVNGTAVSHMKSVGIDPGFVREVIWAGHSLALIVCKFVCGFSYDRKGLRFTLLLCQGAAVVALTGLALAANTPFGIAMAWVYSVPSTLAVALETVGVALITGDLYGNRDYAKFLGINTAINAAGMALGIPLLGLAKDLLGSYTPAIWAGAAIMAVALVAFQFVISAAHKVRDTVVAAEAE